MANNTNEEIQKSYVEQCLSIKNELFSMLRKAHDDTNKKNEKYLDDANLIEQKLLPLITDVNNALDGLKAESELIRKTLDDKVKESKKLLKEEFEKLKEQYELGSICINTIVKRMDDLEGYIKDERFHDIVKDINELEEQFKQEAIKLVQKRMKEKK